MWRKFLGWWEREGKSQFKSGLQSNHSSQIESGWREKEECLQEKNRIKKLPDVFTLLRVILQFLGEFDEVNKC